MLRELQRSKGKAHKVPGAFWLFSKYQFSLSASLSLSFCFAAERASGQRNRNPEKPGKQKYRFNQDQAVREGQAKNFPPLPPALVTIHSSEVSTQGGIFAPGGGEAGVRLPPLSKDLKSSEQKPSSSALVMNQGTRTPGTPSRPLPSRWPGPL